MYSLGMQIPGKSFCLFENLILLFTKFALASARNIEGCEETSFYGASQILMHTEDHEPSLSLIVLKN